MMRALAGLADRFLDFLLGLAHDLLDASRMDAAVRDEPLERDPRDLAPNRVVARDDDRFGRVVDDDIDAGGGLDRADVAALAADDAALHLVVGQRDHRDRALGDELAGQPLDRDRDDPLGAPVGLLARLLLDHADMAWRRRVRACPIISSISGALGLLAGQAGDRFELGRAPRRSAPDARASLSVRLFSRVRTLWSRRLRSASRRSNASRRFSKLSSRASSLLSSAVSSRCVRAPRVRLARAPRPEDPWP